MRNRLKISFVFSALAGIFLLTNCHFLEVDPIGKTTIPLFFSNMDGIRAALPGAYSAMYDYYDTEFSKYPEVAGDMARLNIVGEGTDMIDQYNFTSNASQETGAVGYIWRKIFVALANVNNILEYQPALLEKYPEHANELRRIRGEALFLRALCHFDLCRVYAQPFNYTSDGSHLGIPVLLKTPGANDNVARKSTREVYDRIVRDLKDAENEFAGIAERDVYHASLKSVQAFLARVYLYQEEWQLAADYASQVIATTPLTPRERYLGMYNNMELGEECILRLNGTLKTSKLSKFYSFQVPVVYPADTLLSFFDDPQDIRLQLLKPAADSSYQIRKYWVKKEVSEKEIHYDPFILRVSEQYLIRAEAYVNMNKLKEAAQDVSALRTRATGKLTEDVRVASGDKESLAREVEIERIKELCFEGHRFFDITRRKKDLIRDVKTNSSVRIKTYPNDWFVLPIPQKELEANTNMQPNPGVN